MKLFGALLVIMVIFAGASTAGALTVDEIERLKKAGVSDAVIQKMIEQEGAGASKTGPITETQDTITYSAGKGSKARAQRNREHEKYKEQKSLEALQGVVIDTRTVPAPVVPAPQPGTGEKTP